MNDIEILKANIDCLRNRKPFKYTNEQKAQAIENLIQRNKELEQIEKEHKEENGRLREEIDKKDKIINEMAEVLNDFDYDKQCEICHTDICSASVDGTEYMKCIIEYFTNKVEEDIKE